MPAFPSSGKLVAFAANIHRGVVGTESLSEIFIDEGDEDLAHLFRGLGVRFYFEDSMLGGSFEHHPNVLTTLFLGRLLTHVGP